MARTYDTRTILLVVIVGLFLFSIGVLTGYFGRKNSETAPPPSALESSNTYALSHYKKSNAEFLINTVNADRIKENLRILTTKPHLAGSVEDENIGSILEKKWKELGFETKTHVYTVLLSEPNKDSPNFVELLNKTRDVQVRSPLAEKDLTKEFNMSSIVPPFNGYSAKGDINTDRVYYVNYATEEDFKFLSKTNNLTGAIVIARYGRIFRGDKVNLATKYGAAGVILYSDPADYAMNGTSPDDVYPETWWMPPTGVQRGTLYLGSGDPLTPGLPSLDSAFRLKETDPAAQLPTIPCHPIDYNTAKEILKELGGVDAPSEWQGKLGFTYKIGPSLNQSGWSIRLTVSTSSISRSVSNVAGIIRGVVEPDRYVILGNHRDAWVFGAIDPSSGTACMMEVGRAFGELLKKGWKPRRSILLLSWSAEEQGLIGSTEWVENFVKVLGPRAVSYLNVDICMEGRYALHARGTPSLHQAIFEATKMVPNPEASERAQFPTVYDKWLQAHKSRVKIPYITTPGSGSDHYPFMVRGIASLDMRYDFHRQSNLSSYPLYHSAYETFKMVTDTMDPTFEFHAATCKVWGTVALMIADGIVLPMSAENYGKFLSKNFESLQNKNFTTLTKLSDIMGNLSKVVDQFEEATKAFQDRITHLDTNDILKVRAINDQLIQLERGFVDPRGLPGRKDVGHILFAKSSTNSYAGSSFPGLSDLLSEDPINEVAVKKHLATIIFTVRAVTNSMQDPLTFSQ